jgi:hypothetical protein
MGQHPKNEDMRLNREQESWCEHISSFVLAGTTGSMEVGTIACNPYNQ